MRTLARILVPICLNGQDRFWPSNCLDWRLICLCSLDVQIDENVQREIINHRSLRHPNIVRFKEVSCIWKVSTGRMLQAHCLVDATATM